MIICFICSGILIGIGFNYNKYNKVKSVYDDEPSVLDNVFFDMVETGYKRLLTKKIIKKNIKTPIMIRKSIYLKNKLYKKRRKWYI
jgi:hypothetical protein